MLMVYHPDMEQVEADEVRELLEQLIGLGWTQTEIAAKLGCSQITVNRWRNGKRAPPYRKILALALQRLLRSKEGASKRL
jgi:transcriptional regulator with XRE-family HTH domain